MSIILNGTTIDNIIYNGTSLDKVIYNGVEVWTKSVATPVKGTVINMNLGNGTKKYRVLKVVDGNIVEVVALYDYSTSQKFYSSNNQPTTTFTGSQTTGIKYADSDLDVALNTTFYNSLSSTAKAAIVSKDIEQDMWNVVTSQSGSDYDCRIQLADGATYDFIYVYNNGCGVATIGSRNIYALSTGEILEYLGSNEVSYNEIVNMFLLNKTQKDFWLRSASYSSNSAVNVVSYRLKSLYNSPTTFTNKCAARPAFQIDLSKISWT